MIYSMTGYAARTRAVKGGALHIELKSVNSRYLDCHFRVCDELRIAEPALRELFGARLGRGKLECRVSFVASDRAVRQQLNLNADLLERLSGFDAQVRSVLPLAAPLTVNDVLRWPGIFGDDSVDVELLVPGLSGAGRRGARRFHRQPGARGRKARGRDPERVARMRVLAREVEPRIPAAQAAFNEKLRQRLLDAVQMVDDERIRQEVAVFARGSMSPRNWRAFDPSR
jgi:uncharacterized protein (TIGR00255 family)